MMLPAHTHRLRLILVGVDFSTRSAQALRYAAATARAAGGRVVALHAEDPLSRPAMARGLVEDVRGELERFIRRTLGAKTAKAVEFTIVEGPARLALIAEARRRHADLVVLGTAGRDKLSKTFFGSTTEAVLRRHDGAVMIVPRQCSRPPADWPGGSLVAAIAPGPQRRAMLSNAADAAALFGGGLTVIEPPLATERARWHPAPLVLLPMPRTARLNMFRQGRAAYVLVRRSDVPVIVMHTGRRIGHREVRRAAA